MRFPYVLFDVGETLLGPSQPFGQTYAGVFRELGVEHCGDRLDEVILQVAQESSDRAGGRDRYADGETAYWLDFIERTLRGIGVAPSPDGLARKALGELRNHFRDPAAWRIYPDVPPVLRELKSAGARLAIVSNWDSRLPEVLDRLDLSRWFEEIGVSHLEGIEKPDPEFFRRVLSRLGGSPERTLHVGDVPQLDLAGARAAGIEGLLVDRRGKLGSRWSTVLEPELIARVRSRGFPAADRTGGRSLNAGNRLPAGQAATTNWPLVDGGDAPPRIDLKTWRLRVWGQVEQEMEWSWDEFIDLPQIDVDADVHCVEGWSLLDRRWSGVSARELLGRVRLKSDAAFVMVHAVGDYCANLSLSSFAAADTLLALRVDNEPLLPEHGWPLRLVVPRLYLWKSVKWIRGIEFLNKDWPGSREMAGELRRPEPAWR